MVIKNMIWNNKIFAIFSKHNINYQRHQEKTRNLLWTKCRCIRRNLISLILFSQYVIIKFIITSIWRFIINLIHIKNYICFANIQKSRNKRKCLDNIKIYCQIQSFVDNILFLFIKNNLFIFFMRNYFWRTSLCLQKI